MNMKKILTTERGFISGKGLRMQLLHNMQQGRLITLTLTKQCQTKRQTEDRQIQTTTDYSAAPPNLLSGLDQYQKYPGCQSNKYVLPPHQQDCCYPNDITKKKTMIMIPTTMPTLSTPVAAAVILQEQGRQTLPQHQRIGTTIKSTNLRECHPQNRYQLLPLQWSISLSFSLHSNMVKY